jgi:hypothetical protein
MGIAVIAKVTGSTLITKELGRLTSNSMNFLMSPTKAGTI